jgi:anti-anti-sigma factor
VIISSRTPEGVPNRCPVCGSDLKLEPSDPAGDAPCPHCGVLLWFDEAGPDDLVIDLAAVTRLRPDSLEETLDRIREETSMRGVGRVVLDFGDVPSLTSAVLGKLINLKKVVNSVHGRLRLRNIHPDLREVFRITRLDQVFETDA